MASDWIPMRVDLPRDPQVIAIADRLRESGELAGLVCEDRNVTRYAALCVTVTALLHVWGACNAQGHADGDDLVLKHARLDTLDHLAGITGFGAAMAAVDWAVEEPGVGVRFPKFLIHNVPSALRFREQAADRQRRYRERRKAQEAEQRAASPSRNGHATHNVTDNGTVQNSTSGTPPSDPPSRRRRSGGSTDKGAKQAYPDGFERLWGERPKRDGTDPKRRAYQAYNARLRDGYTVEQMVSGVVAYRGWLEAKGKIGTEFVLQTATFLGPDCHFLGDWTIRSSPGGSVSPEVRERAQEAWKRLWDYLSGRMSHAGIRSKDPEVAAAADALGGIAKLKMSREDEVRQMWGRFLAWFAEHPETADKAAGGE